MKSNYQMFLTILLGCVFIWFISEKEISLTKCNIDEVDKIVSGGALYLPSNCVLEFDSERFIAGDVVIHGNGSVLLSSGENRLFTVRNDASLTLYDMRLTGVNISEGSVKANSEGGIIYNEGYVVIDNVEIMDNTVYQGHGVGIFNSHVGILGIVHSTIQDNIAIGGSGGGVYNEGVLSIESSRVIGNSTFFDKEFVRGDPLQQIGYGGGIFNVGIVTISESYISQNHANSGAGIINASSIGEIHIISSVINENVVLTNNGYAGHGGGIFNLGSIWIESTEITNNQVSYDGGGIFNDGILSIHNSILSGNLSLIPGECVSTGVYNAPAWITSASTDVRHNFWGASNGPSGDGQGYGDGVCGLRQADYTPWLAEPLNVINLNLLSVR